jgi:hypothetical protein
MTKLVFIGGTSTACQNSHWLNQVERFFALITDRAIRRGSFTSVKQTRAAHQDRIPRTEDDRGHHLAKINVGLNTSLLEVGSR